MKRAILVILAFLFIFTFSACMKLPQADIPSASRTPTASPTPAQTATPLPTETETPIITDGPIPGLLGDKWYDWDKVGAYPGASVVQCEDKIAFQKFKESDNHSLNCYLSFANPDGSNCVQTKVLNSYNPNYKDGWVYIIYKDDCIYKVKTDGSSLTRVFKAQRSIAGTTGILLSDLLIVDDYIYFFENIEYDKKAKSIFLRMNLDGSGAVILDEFDQDKPDDKGLNAPVMGGYTFSLFYDSGKLYYINAKSELNQYDISADKNTCVTNNLAIDYSNKIAVRGDKIYHEYNGKLYNYTISTGKDEVFAPAENIGLIDFGFFDRWLLITSDDGLYCYDLESGKLYLKSGDITGNALNVIPTKNYVYLEEEEDAPFLWPIIFLDGEVTVGDGFNAIK